MSPAALACNDELGDAMALFQGVQRLQHDQRLVARAPAAVVTGRAVGAWSTEVDVRRAQPPRPDDCVRAELFAAQPLMALGPHLVEVAVQEQHDPAGGLRQAS